MLNKIQQWIYEKKYKKYYIPIQEHIFILKKNVALRNKKYANKIAA